MDNCCKGWGRHQVAQTQTCLIYQKSVINPLFGQSYIILFEQFIPCVHNYIPLRFVISKTKYYEQTETYDPCLAAIFHIKVPNQNQATNFI